MEVRFILRANRGPITRQIINLGLVHFLAKKMQSMKQSFLVIFWSFRAKIFAHGSFINFKITICRFHSLWCQIIKPLLESLSSILKLFLNPLFCFIWWLDGTHHRLKCRLQFILCWWLLTVASRIAPEKRSTEKSTRTLILVNERWTGIGSHHFLNLWLVFGVWWTKT
jgi:hypothetical protein